MTLIILSIILPIKILIIAIQSCRLAKYVHKKKPIRKKLSKLQLSRKSSKNNQFDGDEDGIVINMDKNCRNDENYESESDEEFYESSTLTPEIMKNAMSEFQKGLIDEFTIKPRRMSEIMYENEKIEKHEKK